MEFVFMILLWSRVDTILIASAGAANTCEPKATKKNEKIFGSCVSLLNVN
jgi:hypothetical protein